MVEAGSVCQCCKDFWLNNNKEPMVLDEIKGRRTTMSHLAVLYCRRCDSGDRGDGIHEQILRQSSG